jgi:DNA end-binding protein Ku
MPSRRDTHKWETVMATPAVWRGHLRLALLRCPIALHAVMRTRGELHFHFINPKTGHRVRMVTLDSETDEPAAHRDLVKGYEFAKNRYVLLDDEDYEQARIETSSAMTVGQFVDRGSIDPIWFDASYYVVPDGQAAQDVFVVLRDALRESGRAALSHVVVERRERAVAILPMGKCMVCHTRHGPSDLNDAKSLFGAMPPRASNAEMVRLAEQLIERQIGTFAPDDTEDRYERQLREVIEAKLHGQGTTPHAAEAPIRDNGMGLMAALKASLKLTESGKTARRHHPVPAPTGRAKRKVTTRTRV